MKNYNRLLFIVILASIIIRAICASLVELGNDEVYYRIFALFPQLSYFDHPPLLSWIIRLTTFGGEQPTEILVRLSSIIIGAINTYIIYRIARNPLFGNKESDNQPNDRRGFFAALLYTSSIYCSIIVGTFIMPDTPMSLFWLLTILLMICILPSQSTYNHSIMLAIGALIGVAMLSKYTGGYLWGAIGIYVLLFNRKLLKEWSLYVAPFISILVFLPVIIWNYQNDWISFTFHSARVVSESSLEWLYFGREIMGGFLYSNPINYILIICALAAFWGKRKAYLSRDAFRLMICLSLPMIALFAAISLSAETLPHWAAPGFFALIIIAASYLNSIRANIARRWAWSAVGLTVGALMLAVVVINHGVIIRPNPAQGVSELGRYEVTLDMYGWRQLAEKFSKIREHDIATQIMPQDADIVSYRWDEAAHLDCYVALPNSLLLKTVGDINDTHLYDWITRWRGGIDTADTTQSSYIIVSSRVYDPAAAVFTELGVDPTQNADTIRIERAGENVVNFFVYRRNQLTKESN